MPFFVLPKKVEAIISTRRIVINESNVAEFRNETIKELVASSSRASIKRLAKSNENSTNVARESKTVLQSNSINQKPELAYVSQSNPFFENQFPVYSNFV